MKNIKIENSFKLIVSIICILALSFVYSSEQAFAAGPSVSGIKARVVANKTVQVSWSKKTGVDGYTVYVASKKRGKYKAKRTVAGDATSGNVGGLKIGKTYYFKVRAYAMSEGKKVYGKDSKKVKCVVKVAPPRVTATAVKKTTKKIRISYSKSTGAKGYEIWRATNRNGKYKKIRTQSGTSYTDSSIGANKVYYYKVRAFSKKKKKKIYGGYSAIVEEISGGNSHQFDLKRYAEDENSMLKGKKILFLGSSITLGTGTKTTGVTGEYMSFADYLRQIDGVDAEKEAVSGTTISRVATDNYVDRLTENVAYDRDRKLVVCQLSTNDAKFDIPAEDENGSEASNDEDGEYSDTLRELYNKATTVRGAIDYIVVYSRDVLGCDVVFYVVPQFASDDKFDANDYAGFRESLLKAEEYWDTQEGYSVDVIDMWSDTDNFSGFNKSNSQNQTRAFYMKDAVHPTKAGYLEKFLPKFRDYLRSYYNR